MWVLPYFLYGGDDGYFFFFRKVTLDQPGNYPNYYISLLCPLATFFGALGTFLAFFVQYKANLNLQEKDEKQQKQIEAEQQNKMREDVVSRFYELLKLHKNNVDSISWNELLNDYKLMKSQDGNEINDGIVIEKQGNQIFNNFLIEFDLIYTLLKQKGVPQSDLVKATYDYFYKSQKKVDLNNLLRSVVDVLKYSLTEEFFVDSCLTSFTTNDENLKDVMNDEGLKDVLKKIFKKRGFFINKSLGDGCIDILNHYYRHLYLVVKYVVNSSLSYTQKRELLRVLRAQMTRQEQAMLFYNWISGCGSQWEESKDNGNHFFSDYRMIHNLVPWDLIFVRDCDLDVRIRNELNLRYKGEEKLNEIKIVASFVEILKAEIHQINSKNWMYEKVNDKLFEFEDWYDEKRTQFGESLYDMRIEKKYYKFYNRKGKKFLMMGKNSVNDIVDKIYREKFDVKSVEIIDGSSINNEMIDKIKRDGCVVRKCNG